MKTELDPSILSSLELRALVGAAAPVLESAIGIPAERVTATWASRIDERGRSVLHLTISDWNGQAQADFSPEELAQPERAKWRFYRMWGDLLQSAIVQRLHTLEAIGAESQEN